MDKWDGATHGSRALELHYWSLEYSTSRNEYELNMNQGVCITKGIE